MSDFEDSDFELEPFESSEEESSYSDSDSDDNEDNPGVLPTLSKRFGKRVPVEWKFDQLFPSVGEAKKFIKLEKPLMTYNSKTTSRSGANI